MHNLRKSLIVKVIFITIICLLISGCAFKKGKKDSASFNQNTITNVNKKSSATTSQSNISKQQDEKFIEVSKKKLEKNENNNIIEIEYPFIIKHNYSSQTVEKINKTIESFINSKLNEVKSLGNFGVLGISCNYHFYKPKDIFSVIFFIDGGGSGGYYESKTFNFNLRNGELLRREDLINNSALKRIRSYITFLSATCSNIELKTQKYQESLSQATENTDIQIYDKMLLKDDGIEIYFPSFDIDPNGKNYAKFYIKFDELRKNIINKVEINSSSELESLLKMNLKDIKSKFGLCDITYIWEGVVYYSIGAIEWAFNPENGVYEEADFKMPNVVVFREGSTLFGVEIMKTTPEQAYEILKNNNSGEIKEVTRGEGPDSEEVVTCELNNGITIYFEAGRDSIDSNELKVVNAIVKWNDIRN